MLHFCRQPERDVPHLFFFWMPWHINQAWNTYHGRRCPSLRYYPRLSTEPEVCDLVSRYIFSRNSPHQSRITNFFECLQRNKKVTVFVAQASSYQKHNYVLTFVLCIYWKNACLNNTSYLFWTHVFAIVCLYSVCELIKCRFYVTVNANDIYNELLLWQYPIFLVYSI